MKTFVTSIILALSLISISIICHGGESDTKTGAAGRVNKPESNRPTAPSHAYIYFTYTRGHIDFTLSTTMEYIDIIISKDDIPIWSGTVTQDEPSADLPILYGEHTIACITENGHVYLGYLDF